MAKRRFDQKQDRVDYGELLMEDSDFELDQAVGMTYSLDMEALMGIPICLGMQGEMTSQQRNDPLYILEAIRRTGKKLSIFCNAGCIKVPKSESRLFALLEESIHEVRMSRSTYNFHPKLWILQYHNVKNDRILIKVVVLSRNLTFDQNMDIAIEMTGYVGRKTNPKNQPLIDMIRFVSQFDHKKNKYDLLISNLKRIEDFELLDCFKDYKFHSFGINEKKTAKDLFRDCDALFIISPFLTEEVITDLLDDQKMGKGPTQRCLITRETSVTKNIFHAFRKRNGDGVWVIDPVFSSNDVLDDGETFGYVNRDIHAKVYYTEKYNEPHRLYIGSLNASKNAFENNVEFLLELQYKDYHSSYQNIKDDFLPKKECVFAPMMNFKEELLKQEEEKVDFRQEVYSITAARIIEGKENFNIEIYTKNDYDNVMICPFFVKKLKKPLTKITRFEEIELNDLSNMFILLKDGSECLIRLEVEHMPVKERYDAIFNEMIKNKSVFMNYMCYLLDDDFYDMIRSKEIFGNGAEAGRDDEGYSFTVEPDIYEKMLRVSAQHPEKFDVMYEISRRLDDSKTGKEFKQLLELFMKATNRKRKEVHDSKRFSRGNSRSNC